MRLRCLLALTLLTFSHATTTAPAAAGPPPSSSRAGREGRSLLQQQQQLVEAQTSLHGGHPTASRVIIHPPSRPITHVGGLSSKSLLLVVSGYRRAYVEAQVGDGRVDEAGMKIQRFVALCVATLVWSY